jgi:hypothetical protein
MMWGEEGRLQETAGFLSTLTLFSKFISFFWLCPQLYDYPDFCVYFILKTVCFQKNSEVGLEM